jgi:hypothetical protein
LVGALQIDDRVGGARPRWPSLLSQAAALRRLARAIARALAHVVREAGCVIRADDPSRIAVAYPATGAQVALPEELAVT